MAFASMHLHDGFCKYASTYLPFGNHHDVKTIEFGAVLHDDKNHRPHVLLLGLPWHVSDHRKWGHKALSTASAL